MSESISAKARRAMRALSDELENDEDRAELERLVRKVKPKPVKRKRETADMVKGISGMIRALGVAAGNGDEDDLRALNELHAVLDEAIIEAVRGQRTQLDRGVSGSNASWQHVANAFGTTRSAAFQRFGEKIATVEAEEISA